MRITVLRVILDRTALVPELSPTQVAAWMDTIAQVAQRPISLQMGSLETCALSVTTAQLDSDNHWSVLPGRMLM